MKKTLAILLTLLMMLGLVGAPVLAAPTPPSPSVGTADDFGTDNGVAPGTNTAGTQVFVKVDVSNLSATVPLTATVVAKSLGGAVNAPAPESYKIVNNSLLKIQVTNITIDQFNTSSPLTLIKHAATPAFTSPDQIALAVASGSGSVSFDPAAPSTANPTGFVIDAGTWNSGTGAVTGKDFGLQLSGSTSPITKIDTELSDHVVRIKYTIAAAASDTAPSTGATTPVPPAPGP